jgi:amidase
MKATHGLVPYTGVMPIEITVDHVGPMTSSVADNALLLEVIAGDDGFDPRQRSPRTHRYTEALGRGVKGLRIAVLKEGFEAPTADPVVNECVRAAAERLRGLSAKVQEVSLPMHLQAGQMCQPILGEGAARTLFWGDGYGGSRSDLYSIALMERFRNWRQQADELSDSAKLVLLAGTHANNLYGGRYYAKATNIARRLRAAYDRLLVDHDLLLMPTTPSRATPLSGPDTDRMFAFAESFGLMFNTIPFDVTHHPAMSVPCAMPDGLPVGLMLVGRHFDEPSIYRAAHAFEQSCDWTQLQL